MLKIWIRHHEWAQSKPRQIDDKTLLDLLRICEYQAKRTALLEDICVQDNGDPADALFMYVLDALGVPPTGHQKLLSGENPRFSRECSFKRDWFNELFYSDYLLENDKHNYSLDDVLLLMKKEVENNIDMHYQ